MKVPYNWLRDYVDIPYPPQELAQRLTMSGIEVGAVEIFAPLDEHFVAAQIEEILPHPQAQNLLVVKVNAGENILTIVCGARNFKKKDMVVLALPGAILPGGKRIGVAEIKGVVSQGMLCSGTELGLDIVQEDEGILILDEKCSPGTKLTEVLFLNEPVLDLDLTPNRADCLGLLGVAREVAALTGGEIKVPPSQVEERGRDIRELADVEVREPELCPRYTARVMEGFKIAPSPLNMQLRLLSVGIRAIYNIVDVTNYLMWETGFPMHAFDYDKLEKGKIVVRRAYPGEKLVTLDGITRTLDPEVLVIADDRVPVGLAGVMGGENTEITEKTTRLLLEVACFNPVNIRKTARKMNLPSEASQRYEKGVDPEAAIFVQNRAVRLIQKTAGGEICRGIIDSYPHPYSAPRINLRTKRVKEILGYSIGKDEITNILGRLGLKVKSAELSKKEAVDGGATLTVEVPSFRRDLHGEIDLIEEIARINGYDKIPATLPKGVLTSGRPSGRQRTLERVREILIGCGLQEIITFSFMNPRLFDSLFLPSDDVRRGAVTLQNPLTEEQRVLRTTLIPNILQVMQYNFNRQVDNQLIFEIGKIFIPSAEENELPEEKMMVAVALSGKMPQNDWQNKPMPLDFYFLKGILEALLDNLGIKKRSWREVQLPFLHPTRGATLIIDGEKAGYLGALHPAVQEKFNFKQDVYLAEVSAEILINHAFLLPSYQPLPRYPSVFRDVAFTVSEKINAGEIIQSIKDCAGELLKNITLFDVYKGSQIPAGHQSLAFSLTFQHRERTLKDEEIDVVQETIEKVLHEKYGAVLRKM